MRRTLSSFWLIFCLAVILIYSFLPLDPAAIDRYYTNGFYRAVAAVLVPLSGGTLLTVTPIALGVAVATLVIVRALRKKRTRGFAGLGYGLWRVLLAGATLYALFILLWGANYARTPLEQRLNLTAQGAREDGAFVEALGAVIRGTQRAELRWDADLKAARESLVHTVWTLEGRAVTLPTHVKRSPEGFLLAAGGATGVTVPWTLETYRDPALPEPLQLAVALHEMAHVAGYGSEAEADFITALAGLTAESDAVRYSTALYFFSRAARSLNPDELTAAFQALPPSAAQTLRDYRDAYARYRAPEFIYELQTAFYDRYLKTQKVASGIGDYDRALTLLRAAKQGGLLRFEQERFVVYPPERSYE